MTQMAYTADYIKKKRISVSHFEKSNLNPIDFNEIDLQTCTSSASGTCSVAARAENAGGR